MALDRLGNTIAAAAVYLVAGKVRRIDGDEILMVLGSEGQHAIRCLAGDIVRVDDTTSGGGGATAHASLTGLSADDHPQYTLANGTRAFSAVVSGVAPTLSAHLATKGYTDFADGVVMSTVAAAAAATFQPLNQILSNLSSFLPSTADRLVYFIDTVGGLAQAAFTAAARTVLDDTTVAAMVDTLGGASSTGSGGLVRATSPTLVTPAIGTPSSGTLTNCTGLPTAGLVNSAVTYAKVQNVSATDKLLGRSTAGAGVVEEIACTAAGRALLDDTTAGAQRATLNLVIGSDVHPHSTTVDEIDALLSDGRPYLFCTDGVVGGGGFSSVQAIDFNAASDGDLLVYDSTASPPWVPMAPRSIVVQIAGALGGTVTWTNIPAAHTFWTAAFVRRIDLTGYRQVRLHAIQSAASNSGSQLRLRYATTFATTVGSYSAIGISEVAVTLTTSGSATGLSSSWINLAAGAKTDVFIGLTGFDGDGAADPQFYAITAEFR